MGITKSRAARWLGTCGAWLLAGHLAAAPPQVDRFFPPSVQRQAETVLEAEGKFENWPVEVWSSTPGLAMTPLETKGQFRVIAAPEVASGVHWVRCYDAQGTSLLRPLVVDSAATIAEKEPNEATDQLQPVGLPAAICGRLGKGGDVDIFAVQLEAGQQLVASLGAQTLLGSPMDAVLQIVSPDGFIVHQNDDTVGVDPQIVYTPPISGVFYVRLFAFPETPTSSIGFAGSGNFVYRLLLTTGPFVHDALPLAVTRGGSATVELLGWNLPAQAQMTLAAGEHDRVTAFHPDWCSWQELEVVDWPSLVFDESAPTPQTISIPASISGRIEADADEDEVVFDGKKDQQISVRAEADSLRSLLDPHISLWDAAGKELAAVDDSNKRPDAELQTKLPADGTYRIRIRDAFRHGGPGYIYRLSVTPTRPDFRLQVKQEHFATEAGKVLEIAVQIDRQHGFDQQIEITADGLPPTAAVEKVLSEPQGDSAKEVLLKITCKEGGLNQPFRIVGRAQDLARTATFSPENASVRLDALWITARP